MTLTQARELVTEAGFTLDTRDMQWRGREVCRLYACREGEEHFLCSIRDFVKMGVTAFRSKLAQLPESGAAS